MNRVRRRMHMDDAADLTDNLSTVLLDLVNEAKDYVLETRNWDFDSRHDGVLNMVASQTTTTATVTLNALGASGPALTLGNYVYRILVSEDSTQGDTNYRIVSSNGTAYTLDAAWLGTTFAGSADARIFVAEYKLPDTVKDILSVRYQSQDLDLVQTDRGLHTVIPRLHDEINDNPRVAVTGSQVTPTYDSTGTAATPGLGLLIYPVPSTAYRIDYSYTVRHPALSSSQSLENVSEAVVHDIVLEAEALAYGSSVANDPDLAQRAHQRVEVRSSRHHAVNTADPNRRMVLKSLDSKGGPRTSGGPADPMRFYTP